MMRRPAEPMLWSMSDLQLHQWPVEPQNYSPMELQLSHSEVILWLVKKNRL